MAFNFSPKVVTDGLKVYLDAGNTKSYTSGSTTWYDLSGNNVNGTLTNGPTFSPEANGCIVFDGIDDIVTTPFNRIQTSSTFEIWANRTEDVNTFNMMAGMYLPYFGFRHGNYLHFSENVGGVQRNLYTNESSSVGSLVNNRWYCFHFINSYDGVNTTMSTYTDGVFKGSITNTGQTVTSTSSNLTLGNWRTGIIDYPFKGKISMFKYYNRTLSAQEILQNYNATKSRFSNITVTVDSDAQAFITAAGITGTTQQSAINTLVLNLKNNGLWVQMTAIYPMVGGTETAHKFNLKDPRDTDAAFRLVFSGGWTHSSTGAKPDGTAWADTKISPSTKLSLNSTHISSYIRNTSTGVLIGVDITYRLWIAPNFDGASKYVEINTQGTTNPSATISNNVGLWVGSRTASGTTALNLNGGVNYSSSATSVGLDTGNIFISARNNGVAGIDRSSAECSFSSVGSGLTTIEINNLYATVQAFQTTLGRQV